MTTITIQQLEAAINVCSNGAKPSPETYALSADVSVLADLYGRMIYLHQNEVPESDLNSAQLALLTSIAATQAAAIA